MDAGAVDAAPNFGSVVVDKPLQLVLVGSSKAGGRLGACASGAVNQQTIWCRVRSPPEPKPAQSTTGANHQQQNQRLQNPHASGHALPLHTEQYGQKNGPVDCHRFACRYQCRDACIAKYGAVQPLFHQNWEGQQRCHGINRPLQAFGPMQSVQPQTESEPHGQNAHADVHNHDKQPLDGARPFQNAVQ